LETLYNDIVVKDTLANFATETLQCSISCFDNKNRFCFCQEAVCIKADQLELPIVFELVIR